jgi:mannose-6-phosphate isomerase-like protein (cupin superfamily)
MEYHALAGPKSDRHMEPFIININAMNDADFVLSSHEGEEFIYVMEGTMEISYGQSSYLLNEGDSIYYDSIVPHHVHAYQGQEAKILAVVYTPI